MDRSGRRGAVVAWAITAGVAFGAVAPAVPALADDRGADSTGSVDVAAPHRARASATTDARTDARTTSPSPGVRGPGSPGGAAPVDPCPWLPPPAPPPMRYPDGGIVVGVQALPGAEPVATFGDRRTVLGEPGDPEVALAPEQPAQSPMPGGPDNAPPRMATPPPVPLAVPAPAMLPAAATAIPPPARSRPATPPAPVPRAFAAPVPAAPVPAAPAPGAPRFPPQLGTPDDLGRIASAALPGLAALVGMTMLGGVIGYRQARAGYLLRAAGAGRFLQ